MASTKTPQHEASTPEAETPDPLAALDEPTEADAELFTEERIKNFVEKGHALHLEKPRKWWAVKLPRTERRKVLSQAKMYAREKNMAVRVKSNSDPDLLVYRVIKAPVKKS